MPLSPFFLNGSPSEQRLVQDLVNEHLTLFGQDILYLPRKIVNRNTVIREITASKFDDSFRLEAYLGNVDGFGTPSDVLSKFGVRAQDEVTLIVSKERYDDFITPFLKLYPEEDRLNAQTPNEGDLIYLPLDNALFEIKYIERKVPFYQLNDLFMYEFRCEIFEPEDEVIDLPDGLTDKEGVEVDDIVGSTSGQVVTLQMEKDTSQNAVAYVSLASTFAGVKSVQRVPMFDGGNYRGVPTVTIFKPDQGNRATGTVTIAEGGIDSVTLTNAGSNYLSVPSISFTPPNKTTSSQIKFGNNSLHHTAISDVIGANFHFTTNVDSRDSGNGRLSLSFWLYPTKFDPAVNGGTVMWTDRFKIYYRETGNIVFASGSGSIENTTQLNLNAWNFIRVEQYNTDATISVNGTVSNSLNTANPIMFFAGDSLKLGADTAGAGFIPSQTASWEGFMDHITLNLTGDNSTRTASAEQVPTSETQQETDVQTSTTAQFIRKLDNEQPIIDVTVTSNSVSALSIAYEGWGYTSVPIMTIEEPAIGSQATAVAIMTTRSGIPNQSVDRILLINPGTGYTTPPQVVFTGGSPVSTAIATAVISEAVLGPIGITTGGRGYTFTPTVGITSVYIQQSNETIPLLQNAQAEAVVSTSGTVTQIRYSNAGAGYTITPAYVAIGSVTSNSFGEYERDELVRGLNSGTEAYVASWDTVNNILQVSVPSGDFAVGEVVVGAASSYRVLSIESDVDGDREFAQNDTFETEATSILDFSERNPFGEF